MFISITNLHIKGLQPVLCPSCSFSWALYFALWLSRGGRLPATLFGHIQSPPSSNFSFFLKFFAARSQQPRCKSLITLSSEESDSIFGLFWVNLSRQTRSSLFVFYDIFLLLCFHKNNSLPWVAVRLATGYQLYSLVATVDDVHLTTRGCWVCSRVYWLLYLRE